MNHAGDCYSRHPDALAGLAVDRDASVAGAFDVAESDDAAVEVVPSVLRSD